MMTPHPPSYQRDFDQPPMRFLRLANRLYDHCYPAYRPMYWAWKAFSDRRERRLLTQLIRPGMTLVDVGANVGVYTHFFSRLAGTTGKVHSFEPSPANFRHLREHIRRLPNVAANQAAVGASSGTARLYVSEDLNVDHRTFDSGDGRSAIDVRLVSLDDYFSDGQRVDFIKIDVQGYEASVLQGARRVVLDNPELRILMEYWPYGLAKASVEPAALIELIGSLDLEIQATDTLRAPLVIGIEQESADFDDYCNLLLRRRSSA